MSQFNKEHAAAMLVHQIGSGIEALNDLPLDIALENIVAIEESFYKFSRFILHLGEIKIAKDTQIRATGNR